MLFTPEQKQIGSDNFNSAVGATRRDFLTTAVAGGAAVGATYFGYQKLQGAPVKVGFIGTGDEGSILINEHPPEYMDIVAVADLRPTNRKRAFNGDNNSVRRGLIKILGSQAEKNIKTYENHKQLLEDPEIEAVVIAVPLSQHAPIAIDAMKAGKHVLCEKLMAHNITECKEMIKVAKETNRLLAVGHQRHYSVLYDNAYHLVQKGLLGDIKFIRAQWHRNNSFPNSDSWKKAIHSEDAQALPKDLCQKYGYKDINQLVRWRLYNETGGGLMAELGSHQLDAASIFLGKVKPLAVQGYGGRNFYGVKGVGPVDKQEDDREIDDHVYVTFEFPGPNYGIDKNDIVIVTYSSINTNRLEPYGETVYGSRGTIIMNQEQEALLYKESGPGVGPGGVDQRLYVVSGKQAGPVMNASESTGPATVASQAVVEKVSRGYTEEMEHFCYCIKNNIYEPPAKGGLRCNGTVAMGDAIMALTSNMAMATKKRIEFKPEWFDPENFEAVPEADPEVIGA